MDLEEENIAADVEQIEQVLNAKDVGQAVERGPECLMSIQTEDHLINENNALVIDENDDGELEDTLETALKLNKAYQEVLKTHLAKILDLMTRNRHRQEIAQTQMFPRMFYKHYVRDCDLFEPPYFRDRAHIGPPRNTDATHRSTMFTNLQPPIIWRVYQEELLMKCLTEQMKAKCLKDLKLRLRIVREALAVRESAEDQQCEEGGRKTNSWMNGDETEDDILHTIECVKDSFDLSQVSPENVIQHADWLLIANHYLEGGVSPECCIAMYRSVCNPHINRSAWTEDEDKKLLELIPKYEASNWQLITEELGTSRSPFLCVQRYQQSLSDYRSQTWTEEQVLSLKHNVSVYTGSNLPIPWIKVAMKVGGMSALECRHLWEQLSDKKRAWTKEEDQLLSEAVEMYKRNLSWQKVATHVKTRASHQCRERWTSSLDPNIRREKFSAREDRLIWDYILEKGESGKRWGQQKVLQSSMPGRTGGNISQRIKTLKRWRAAGRLTTELINAAAEKEGKEREEKKRNHCSKVTSSDTTISTSATSINTAPSTSATSINTTVSTCTSNESGSTLTEVSYPQQGVDVSDIVTMSGNNEREEDSEQEEDGEQADGEGSGGEEEQVVLTSKRRRRLPQKFTETFEPTTKRKRARVVPRRRDNSGSRTPKTN